MMEWNFFDVGEGEESDGGKWGNLHFLLKRFFNHILRILWWRY
jgi:hypothetical protein